MPLRIQKFELGPYQTNAYLLYGQGKALLIDAPEGSSAIKSWLRQEHIGLEVILLTHGHFDHIAGLKEFPGVPVWAHKEEEDLLKSPGKNLSVFWEEETRISPDHFFENEFLFQGEKMEVFSVAGHTPGGAAFYYPPYLFSGDSLFDQSIGRSDLPGGDGKRLVRDIKEKLLTLPPATIVYTGHGEATTIEKERNNPFLND